MATQGFNPEQYGAKRVQNSSRLPPKEDDFQFSPVETVKNVPGSAKRLFGDIYQAVRHPIQTGKALVGVGAGAVQKAIPGEQAQEESFDAVADFFKDRYGGKENILRTLQEDPVGFAADLSAVLTAGGAAVRGVGAVSKASRVAQAGKTVQRFGQAIEPTTALTKGAFIATKPLRVVGGALGRESLGVTTGQGGEVIRQAFRNPTPEFREALRGRVTTNNILTIAREGLDTLRTKRAAQYRSQLAKVKNATEPLDIKPFKEFINQKLGEFNIGVNKKTGALNFSRSTIADASEAKRISQFLQEVRVWKDNTPSGLDILKQRLDDFYTPSGRGRALTTSIASELKKKLRKEVPGYEQMTRGYSEATDLIKEIERSLSLKAGASPDTAITKLTSAMKRDNTVRLQLMDELDAVTGQNMRAVLAGTALSPGVPSGLIGRSIFAGFIGGGAIINPALWSGILVSSPRVVGEFLNVLGLSAKEATRAAKFLTSPQGKASIQSLFQAGRTGELEEEQTFDPTKFGARPAARFGASATQIPPQ